MQVSVFVADSISAAQKYRTVEISTFCSGGFRNSERGFQ